MVEDLISNDVIGAAIKVHKELGPGLLESAYQSCLYYELNVLGYNVQREKPMPIVYNGVEIDCGYRIDLLIDYHVIVEVKAVQKLNEIHLAQLLTYLKLSNIKLGLLINFNNVLLKDGIRRVVNNL
jgi:GxxExxY protein